jgi:predicted acetyltransferase
MLIGTWRDRTSARNGTLGVRFGDPGSGTTDYETKTLPTGVFGTDRYASIVNFNPRTFVLGQFSRPLVLAEDVKLYIAGIPRPPAPTLEKGSGKLSGHWRAAVTFAHVIGNRTIAESALSSPSEEIDLGAPGSSGDGTGGLHITGLPATCVNPRVNRIRGYASFEGARFRRIWERPIGVTTIDDTTAVLAEGGVAPASDTDLPPMGALWGCVYGRRMIYAGGDTKYPYRAYYSEIGRPEAIEGHWDTPSGDPITGLASHDETCWLFSKSKTATVRGYSAKDFVVRNLSESVGCISHFGIKSIHGWLCWPAQDGYWGYSGGLRYLMESARDLWFEEIEANPSGYALAYAEDNRLWNTLEVIVPRSGETLQTKTWVGDYEGFIAGRDPEPEWSRDPKSRMDRVSCCTRSGAMLYGSDDGYTRRADEADADDDGDTYLKHLKYMPGPQAFGDVGGDSDSGKELIDLRFLVESENNEWTAQVIGGDEAAHGQHTGTSLWTKTIAASLQTVVVDGEGTYAYVAKSVHHIGTPKGPTGRMFYFVVEADSPVGFRFRGVEGFWKGGGKASRLYATLNEIAGSVPVLTTPDSSAVADTTATLGGTVTFVGNPVGTSHGVCFAPTSVNADPEEGGTGVTKVEATITVALGAFTVNVTGLTPSTAYSFKAFAENTAGNGYSVVGTFTTSA